MIKEITLTKDHFHPFPSFAERKAWQRLPDDVRNYYLLEANKLKDHFWPSLPASVYLEFYRDGNRSNYERIYFDRRRDLLTLAIAECIEGKGKYLDDIINGIWLICEETTWVIPAHLNHPRPREGSYYHRPGNGGKSANPEPRRLHDPEDDVYIDLFSAETGSLISWVYYLLGDLIAEAAPEVKRRMEEEVSRRILVPFLEQNYFPWMGLSHDDPVNNWNPWINSNVLAAYLIFASVFSRAEQGVNKAIQSINRFIYFYTDDGGCDEGPSYFGVAGASLLDFIEELSHVTDVSYLYLEAKIKNMVSYIYKVYIGKKYYVNYADAPPRVSVAGSTLYRAGKNMGNPALMAFTSYLRSNNWCRNDTISDRSNCVYRLLAGIFAEPEEETNRALRIPTLAWFPGIQVVTARDSEDSYKGFFFSAKGGNNNESHNHNDIGNFLLYCDGLPVLVDAGVETYTKFTFSPTRYDLWTMGSSYHNTPALNGADQMPGKEYCAREVSLTGLHGESPDASSGIRFSLDISGAYPASAKVKSYKRDFVFCPGNYLELTDTYSFGDFSSDENTPPLILNLLCYERPVIQGGRAELSGVVSMEFDSSSFVPEIEEINLIDPKIHNDWQKDHLYRLRLIKKERDKTGTLVLRFTKSSRA